MPKPPSQVGILRLDGVTCCACAATSAPPAFGTHPIKDICRNCWTEFTRFSRQFDKKRTAKEIENDFNGWLSRRVILDLTRLEKNGLVGRCEAVSHYTHGNNGYQCAKAATMLREGRPVCSRHGTIALTVIFVDGSEINPYRVVRNILTRLCLADAKITDILRSAVAEAEALPNRPPPPRERDYLRI